MSNFRDSNSSFNICVDSLVADSISGRILSQRLSAPMHFNGTSNLVLQLDLLMDIQKFPQAFQRGRLFHTTQAECTLAVSTPEDGMSAEEVRGGKGTLFTFTLQILTRRSSTWQGFIRCQEKDATHTFSSMLEFLKLVDNEIAN